MQNEKPTPLMRYGVAVGTIVLALALTFPLMHFIDSSAFALFFVAVMLSAWYGGLGPGLLATGCAVVAIDDLLLPPFGTLTLDLRSLLRLGVFVFVALVINSLTSERKQAEAALRQSQADLERRVQERTTQLASTNAQLQAEIIEREEAQQHVSQISCELAKQNQELLRLEREMGRVAPLAALGRITGTIAHELGTPLNSVLGYTQLLVEDDLPASARESLHIIEAQVQRMVEIIQHYLARTRDSVQHFQPVDINTLITDTLVLLKPVFQHQQIHVTSNLAESMPRLQADSASLQRVLINLFNNALDAMQAGGTLTVTSRLSTPSATNRPGRGVIVEVQDTGIGIPADVLPTVFELFTTTKAPGKGTGLGLGICQEIVKAHGGSLKLKSQEGQGTCVRVFLPIQANDPPVRTEETV